MCVHVSVPESSCEIHGLDTPFRKGNLWNAKPLLHLVQLLILKADTQATIFIKDWSSNLSLLLPPKTSCSWGTFLWFYSLVLSLHDTTPFNLHKGGLDHRKKKEGKSRSEMYSNLWGLGDEFPDSDLILIPSKSSIQLFPPRLGSPGSLQFSEGNLKGPEQFPLKFASVTFLG